MEFLLRKFMVLWPWLLPLAAAAYLAVLGVIQRLEGGRVSARPEPPEKLSAAAAGALLSETVSARHIAGMIFDLARRGHFRIRESKAPAALFAGRDFLFEQLTDHWNELNLNHYEVRALSTIFGSGVRPAMSTLKTWKAFARSWPLMSQSIIDELVALGHFTADPRRLRRRLGLLAAVLAAGTPLLLALVLNWAGRPPWLWSVMGATASMAPLCLAFSFLLPKRTSAGNRALAQVKGFRRFLRHADGLQPPLPPELFARYLPYAVALGEVGKWTAAYRGRSVGDLTWFQGSAEQDGQFAAEVFRYDVDHFTHLLRSALSARLGHEASRRHYLGSGPGAGNRPW